MCACVCPHMNLTFMTLNIMNLTMLRTDYRLYQLQSTLQAKLHHSSLACDIS